MLKGTSLSGSSQWELDPGLSIYKVLLQKCPAVLVLCFLPGSNLMIFFGAEIVREKMFRVMGWPQSTQQNWHWSPDAFFSYLSRARTITSIGLIWKTLIEPSGNPSVNVAWSYWVDAEQGANTGDTNTEGDENWERRRIKIRRKKAIRIRMLFWLKNPFNYSFSLPEHHSRNVYNYLPCPLPWICILRKQLSTEHFWESNEFIH